MASGARTWSCAGPGKASKSVPRAPEGCFLRHFSRIFRTRRRRRGSRGVWSREIAKSQAPIRLLQSEIRASL
eukprot:15459465-Alexandrium_andersonii.AAC.1